MLKKGINDILNQKEFRGKSSLIISLMRIVERIKKLRCEKIVVVFLRPLKAYVMGGLRRKNSSIGKR